MAKQFILLLAMILLFGGYALGQGLVPVRDLPAYQWGAQKSDDQPQFNFHGGATLWYYRPNQSYIDENLSIYFAYLDTDITYENYGVHAETRFSEHKFRGYYPSNIWFQEAYGYYRGSSYIVKVGKEYTHFGKFWDGSYYGNVLYYDGLVLNPDNGVSLEGSLPNVRGWKLNYYAQYFVIDGSTNGSLDPYGQKGEGGLNGEETGDGAPIEPSCIDGNGNFIPGCQSGRDAVSVPGAHRRNEAILRLEPTFTLPHNNKLKLGLNYEYLLADLSPILPRRFNVNRYAADVTFTHVDWSIFFEWVHQQGYTVTDFPLYDQPSKNIDYFWAGTSYKFGKCRAYFNYSDGYYHDENIYDITYVPGLSYEFNQFLSGAVEYANWFRMHSGNVSMNDNSFNFILNMGI